LGDVGELGRIFHDQVSDVDGVLDEGDSGGLAERALDLVVASVPDEDDLIAAAVKAPDFVVDLGDQRTGGVDDAQPEGATPWAENTTVAPSGTSCNSCTNTAPRCSRSATTWRLWTIWRRT
jgi:hypothetical protein